MSRPKDLRDIVEKNRRAGVQDALRDSAGGEDPQLVVMRSRLEQQSELIMMMKQHNEECKQEINGLKSSLREQMEDGKRAREKCRASETERDRIQQRFVTLSTNNDEIIALKDEYKAEAANLRAKVKALEAREKTATGERETKENQLAVQRDKAMAELTAQLERLREEYDVLSAQCEKQAKDSSTHSEKSKRDIACLTSQLAEAKTVAASAQAAASLCEKDKLEAVAKLKEELVQMTSLASSREKLNESLEERLSSEKRQAHEALAMMEDLKAKLKAASADAVASAAKEEVAQLQHKYESLQQEYAAYKRHSASLLKQEKEINARLRHLAESV